MEREIRNQSRCPYGSRSSFEDPISTCSLLSDGFSRSHQFYKDHEASIAPIRKREKKTAHRFTAEQGRRRSRKRVSWGQIYQFYRDEEKNGRMISYRAVARKFGVSPSTVKAWFDSDHLTDFKETFAHLKKAHLNARELSARGQRKKKNFNNDDAQSPSSQNYQTMEKHDNVIVTM